MAEQDESKLQLSAGAKASVAGSSHDDSVTEEDVVCMSDVLAHADSLEQDADAVLGGSDPKNCSYSHGYSKRQALYACSTCTPGDDDEQQSAGICLACSLECHDGHALHELYTKRLFRCDCGNTKFKQSCKISPIKDPSNEKNKYNHNFKGLYCICDKPYPDDGDEVDDDMIQCCMCEDWFHGRHIGVSAPEEYQEMTCASCVTENSFLKQYSAFSQEDVVISPGDVSQNEGTVSITDEIKTEEVKTDTTTSETANEKKNISGTVEPKSAVDETKPDCASQSEIDQAAHNSEGKTLTESNPVSEQTDTSELCDPATECKLITLDKADDESQNKAIFWPAGWREKLCHCIDCLKLYKAKDIEYLLDANDPTHVYEAKSQQAASENGTSLYEQGMSALTNLGRIQQVEMLQGFNDMKSDLRDYLKKFAENDKVVRAEDIQEFFDEYKKNKKLKTTVPPSNCK